MRISVTSILSISIGILLLIGCSKETAKTTVNGLSVNQEKTYGSKSGTLMSLSKTADGNLISAGWSAVSKNGAIPNTDVYVLKVSSALDSAWSKSFGGSKEDNVKQIIATSDGGYFFCAFTTSLDGQVVNNHGATDIWLAKLDANGKMQWSKTYGGSGIDGVNSNCVLLNDNGNYIITGYTNSTNADVTNHIGGYDIWIMEVDTQGNIVKQVTLGSGGDDYPYGLIKNDKGYIVLSKMGSASSTFDKIGSWVFNFDMNGNIFWKSYIDVFNAGKIINTSDGGYLILNSIRQNIADLAVVKMDNVGNVTWTKSFPFDTQDYPNDVIELSKGGYLLLGSSGNSQPTDGRILMIRLDKDGNKVYSKILDDAKASAQSVVEMSDGAIIVGGTINTGSTFINNNFLVLNLSER